MYWCIVSCFDILLSLIRFVMSQVIVIDGKGPLYSSTGAALRVPIDDYGDILDDLFEIFDEYDESMAVHQNIIADIAERKNEESSDLSSPVVTTEIVDVTAPGKSDDSSVFFSGRDILEDSSNPSFPNSRLNNEVEGASRPENKEQLTVQQHIRRQPSAHQAKKTKRRPSFFCEDCWQPKKIRVNGEKEKQEHECPGKPVQGIYPSPYNCKRCNETGTYQVFVNRYRSWRNKTLHICSKKQN